MEDDESPSAPTEQARKRRKTISMVRVRETIAYFLFQEESGNSTLPNENN